MNTSALQQALQAGRLDEALTRVYGQAQLQAQRDRFVTAVQRFDELFGQRDQVRLFTVAGRSEISGKPYRSQPRSCPCCLHRFGYHCGCSKNDREHCRDPK